MAFPIDGDLIVCPRDVEQDGVGSIERKKKRTKNGEMKLTTQTTTETETIAGTKTIKEDPISQSVDISKKVSTSESTVPRCPKPEEAYPEGAQIKGPNTGPCSILKEGKEIEVNPREPPQMHRISPHMLGT